MGGEVRGPRLDGEILPGGADWQIVREDGTAVLQSLAAAGLRPSGLASEKRLFHTLQLVADPLHQLLPDQTRARLDQRAKVLAAAVPADLPRSLRAELRP